MCTLSNRRSDSERVPRRRSTISLARSKYFCLTSSVHITGVETTISQSFSCILVHPFHVGDLWNDAPIVVVYRPLRIAPATDVRRALVSFPGKVQCDASRAL